MKIVHIKCTSESDGLLVSALRKALEISLEHYAPVIFNWNSTPIEVDAMGYLSTIQALFHADRAKPPEVLIDE